jgi:hypothetical protein
MHPPSNEFEYIPSVALEQPQIEQKEQEYEGWRDQICRPHAAQEPQD